MITRDFYQKVNEAFIDAEKAIVGTITGVSGVNDDKEKFIGVKFILGVDRGLTFSESKLSNEEIDLLSQSLQARSNYGEVIKLEEPTLKEIKNNDGITFEVYFEPLFDKPRLIIFGAGHVSLPLAKIAKLVDFEVTVVDDRKEFVTQDRFPEADKLVCQDFEEYLSEVEIGSNDYLVIVTRGHKFDYYVLKEVIESKAKYIGMIGSSKKVGLIFEELSEKDGIDQELINSVYAPIGLDIGSETPEEIGLSIASQLIKVRRLGHE